MADTFSPEPGHSYMPERMRLGPHPDGGGLTGGISGESSVFPSSQWYQNVQNTSTLTGASTSTGTAHIEEDLLTKYGAELLKFSGVSPQFSGISSQLSEAPSSSTSNTPAPKPRPKGRVKTTFTCPEEGCDFSCKSANRMNKHLQTHGSKKLFRCSECEFTTKRNGSLKRHMLIHSDSKPFACTHCEFSTKRVEHLRVHLLRHDKDAQKFPCDQCSFTALEKGNLQRHIKMVHCDERPYVCSVCDYSFKQSHDLKKHLMLHTGERPYKCDQCDYACIKSSGLKQHKLTHLARKPFQCPNCDYSCSHAASLARHLITHQYPTLFACDWCEYTCRRIHSMKGHMDSRHPEKEFDVNQFEKEATERAQNGEVIKIVRPVKKRKKKSKKKGPTAMDGIIDGANTGRQRYPSNLFTSSNEMRDILNQGNNIDQASAFNARDVGNELNMLKTEATEERDHGKIKTENSVFYDQSTSYESRKSDTEKEEPPEYHDSDSTIDGYDDTSQFISQSNNAVSTDSMPTDGMRSSNETDNGYNVGTDEVEQGQNPIKMIYDVEVKHDNVNISPGDNDTAHSTEATSNAGIGECFACSLCHFKCENPIVLRAHMISHPDTRAPEDRYKCLECSYHSTNLATLKRHFLQTHYPNSRSHQCNLCDYAAHTSSSLERHRKMKHDPEFGPRHFCPHCEFTSYYPHALRDHMKRHTRNLQRHQATVHSDVKTYRCEKVPGCNYACKTAAELKRHLMKHSGDPAPYACGLCPYECYRATNLRRHMLKHTQPIQAQSEAEPMTSELPEATEDAVPEATEDVVPEATEDAESEASLSASP